MVLPEKLLILVGAFTRILQQVYHMITTATSPPRSLGFDYASYVTTNNKVKLMPPPSPTPNVPCYNAARKSQPPVCESRAEGGYFKSGARAAAAAAAVASHVSCSHVANKSQSLLVKVK